MAVRKISAPRQTARRTTRAVSTTKSTGRAPSIDAKTAARSTAAARKTKTTKAAKAGGSAAQTKRRPTKHVGDVIGLGRATPPKNVARVASRGGRPKGYEIPARKQGLSQARVAGVGTRRR
jgi:hypothetical protein